MNGRIIPTYNHSLQADGYLLIVKGERARWISVELFDSLPIPSTKAINKQDRKPN